MENYQKNRGKVQNFLANHPHSFARLETTTDHSNDEDVIGSDEPITYDIREVATETTENTTAEGFSKTNYTRFKLKNVKQGDVIMLAGVNSDDTAGWHDGTTTYALHNTTWFTKAFEDNYSWCSYTWTADKDYEILYVASQTNLINTYPNAYPKWTTSADNDISGGDSGDSGEVVENPNLLESNIYGTSAGFDATQLQSLIDSGHNEVYVVTFRDGSPYGHGVTCSVGRNSAYGYTNILANVTSADGTLMLEYTSASKVLTDTPNKSVSKWSTQALLNQLNTSISDGTIDTTKETPTIGITCMSPTKIERVLYPYNPNYKV